jgi:uncharacterized protein
MAVGLAVVPESTVLRLDVLLEEVTDGVLATVRGAVPVRAECARCLDPIGFTLDLEVRELYAHPGEYVGEDDRTVEDDHVDLEPVLRDAVVLELPSAPLCRPDCPGLCPDCGARLADDPQHTHDTIDPRWAALEGLRTVDQTDTPPELPVARAEE